MSRSLDSSDGENRITLYHNRLFEKEMKVHPRYIPGTVNAKDLIFLHALYFGCFFGLVAHSFFLGARAIGVMIASQLGFRSFFVTRAILILG